MAEPATTTEGTEAPGGHHEAAGFPPFKTETFPSQLFWLVITFVVLSAAKIMLLRAEKAKGL